MEPENGQYPEASRLVRHYMREQQSPRPPASHTLPLEALLGAGGALRSVTVSQPASRQIVTLCTSGAVMAVADVASEVGLPLETIRVLLTDLMEDDVLEVKAVAAHPADRRDAHEHIVELLDGIAEL